MSNCYIAIVDRKASAEEAPSLGRRVVEALAGVGLVSPFEVEGCLIGNEKGYPPGERIKQLYIPDSDECVLWNLTTNGLEVAAYKWVNQFGLTCLQEIHCPECRAAFGYPYDAPEQLTDDHNAWEQLSDAIDRFYQGDLSPMIRCPACGRDVVAFEWATDPHLGFANLAFCFWNWPRFDSPQWKIDIQRTINDAIGRPTILTYGGI